MDRAEKLINHLLSHPDTNESGSAAYELLKQYQRGAPVESLRTLLFSSDDRLAGEAAWIASELPEGRPLLHDIGALLAHRSRKVRFWAIDCVHLWASSSDGGEVAAASALIDDPDSAVRWKAMGLWAMASREQLAAALSDLRAADPRSQYIDELTWMLGQEGADSAEVIAALNGADDRRRKVAVAAAYRLATARNNPAALRYATSVGDTDVLQFAADMLERLGTS
jgi:hypothetical protein